MSIFLSILKNRLQGSRRKELRRVDRNIDLADNFNNSLDNRIEAKEDPNILLDL